jgi:hypothetical protein
MARRRYQKGSVRKRGTRIPIWELQWWADYVRADGTIGRRRESKTLGYAADLTKRQALRLAEEVLRPLNQGKLLPAATITFGEFIEKYFVPNALPTLKLSTRNRYRSTLNFYLVPAFGPKRLCDISTLALQSFVLAKFDSGSGWELCNHLRNLMSKIFSCAKSWRQSGRRGSAAGEDRGAGETCPHPGTMSKSAQLSVRAAANDGPDGNPGRLARRRNPWPALGGRRSRCEADPHRAGRLSRCVRESEDEGKQTDGSRSRTSGSGAGIALRGVAASEWACLPNPDRKPPTTTPTCSTGI